MKKFLYHHSVAIVLLCLGVFGLLGGFYNALDFPSDANVIVYLWMIMATILYCLQACNKKPRYITTVFLASIGVASVLSLLDILTLIGGLQEVFLYDYYLSFASLFTTYHTSTITILILYMSIGLLVTEVLLYYLFNYRHQKLILFVSIIWLFFPYFINHEIEYVYVYPSILFVLCSYVYTTSLRSLDGKGNKIALIILVMLIGVLAAFDKTIGNNNRLQKNIVEIFDGLSYLKEEGETGQKAGSSIKPETSLPTGNIATNLDEALKVTATTPFSGYLRGYSLSRYRDNGWDTPKKGYSYSSVNYYAKAISNSSSLQVQITSLKGHSYQFIPYHTNIATTMTLDSFITLNDINYTMYQGNPDTIVKIDREYLEYVDDNYLEVDTATKELLQTYFQQKNIAIEDLKILSIEQKIEYIATLLKNNTSYSLSPGQLPLGKDFIDYFLNDSKQGSCTHYATTATLLLRMLDIPTRYTSGFVIDKNDFKNNEAIIKNNRSHAWVEVFDANYGWYPVEMTPSNNQTAPEQTTTPTGITTMLDNQSGVTQDVPTNQTPTIDTPMQNQSPTQSTISPWVCFVGISIVMIVMFIVLSIGQYKLRYYRKISKYKKLSNNKKVCLGYLYLLDCKIDGTNIEALYLKARFSQHQITAAELQFIEEYIKQQVPLIYKSFPVYKKGFFRYIKAKG